MCQVALDAIDTLNPWMQKYNPSPKQKMALAVICITIRVFSYSHALQMSQQGRAYTGSMTNPLYLATNKIPPLWC